MSACRGCRIRLAGYGRDLCYSCEHTPEAASLADDPAALERSAECAWNASPSFHTLKWYMLGEKEKDTYRAYMTRVLRAAEGDTDV